MRHRPGQARPKPAPGRAILTRAKLVDHAHVVWTTYARPLLVGLAGLLVLAQLGLWLALAEESMPGCWSDAPPPEGGWGINQNWSAHMAWKSAHPGECWQTSAAALPAGALLRAWAVLSIWGSIGAGLMLALVGLALAAASTYRRKLRVVVAKREDKERNAEEMNR